MLDYNCSTETPEIFYRITGRPHHDEEIMPPRVTWSTNEFKGCSGYFITDRQSIKSWLEVLDGRSYIYIVKPLSTPVQCHLNSDLKQWFVHGSIKIIKDVTSKHIMEV